MRKFLLCGVALVTLASPAIASDVDAATDAAIVAVLASNDEVRGAIDTDVCHDENDYDELPFMDSYWARTQLRASDVAGYDAVRDALHVAYAASEGTDGALEAVQAAFCDAVTER